MPHFLSPSQSKPSQSKPTRFTLNSDGRSHPIENLLSIVTLVLGAIAFITALIPAAHPVAAWSGAIGLAVGLYSQYISATTPERSLNIIGIVGSFLGVVLGIYHGGFLPG